MGHEGGGKDEAVSGDEAAGTGNTDGSQDVIPGAHQCLDGGMVQFRNDGCRLRSHLVLKDDESQEDEVRFDGFAGDALGISQRQGSDVFAGTCNDTIRILFLGSGPGPPPSLSIN